VGPGGLGQGGGQAAAGADRGGDVVLDPVARLVVLVGQQVLRYLDLADGGADDAVASQAFSQAIPVHRPLAEDTGQGPEGHAEGTQEQRPLDGVGAARQVGQDEGRANGEGLSGSLEADTAQAQAGLLGGADVL